MNEELYKAKADLKYSDKRLSSTFSDTNNLIQTMTIAAVAAGLMILGYELFKRKK